MKVLFDHNLPHTLRTVLATACSHEIVTTSYLGWGHLKNGELMSAAENAGFAILVTGDRTLVYEQNLAGRRIAIIALSTNNWPLLKNSVAPILAAIDNAVPGVFLEVSCGEFSRKRFPGQP